MRHNAWFFSMIGLAVCFVLTGVGPARSQGQQVAVDYVRLKFSPPNGTTCLRKMLVTKTVKFGGEKVESEATRLENTLVFRTTPRKVSITLKPRISTSSRRRMERMQDFIGGLLTTSDITINYDREGRFLNLSGLKRASETLRDSVPKLVRPLVDRLLPMAISNFQTRWQYRFYQFTTQNFPVGKFRSVKQKMPLPSGQTIDVTAEWAVRGQNKIRGMNIVRLFSGYTSTDPAMGSALGSTMLDMLIEGLKSFKLPGAKKAIKQLENRFPKFIVDQFWFTNDRYLDSATMITYSETERRIMHITLRDAQGGVKAAVQHRTDYEYDCS